MEHPIYLYNSASRKKEHFVPINEPYVGMYLCGPTVYGDAHLGHSRGAITFDVLFRYMQHLGYKVRYIRNITDVGHLENDADEGEDKIAKKARLEQKEPMEIVQHYTNAYHRNLRSLNLLEPSIEPRATGHIIEQIEMVQKIMDAGLAYESNGSVYFDINKYSKDHKYGSLSGRVLEDLVQSGRNLDGQDEKRSPLDFAIWKKASKEHIMRWPSSWSEGFPGWHLECSAMSTKYLGETFDIHGGGMDLLFPHHECEIAQSVASTGKEPVKYWVHNNMITIGGQKMAKSLGNYITLDALFSGDAEILEQAYSPMTMKFFVLQAHYRSTLDFSNEALKAAEKGYKKLLGAIHKIPSLPTGVKSSFNVEEKVRAGFAALSDDISTPTVIAELFDTIKLLNLVEIGKESISAQDKDKVNSYFHTMVFDLLGLKDERGDENDSTDELMTLLLELRSNAKNNRDFETADAIRNNLSEMGIEVKDGAEGTIWKRK